MTGGMRAMLTRWWFWVLPLMLCLPQASVLAEDIAVDADCSLRDAIIASNTDAPSGGCPAGAGADSIIMTSDVTLTEALPAIGSAVSIEGGGYTISGDNRFRIFDVRGGRLAIKNVTLTDGETDWRQDAEGGAIRLRGGARVSIENSTLVNNAAGAGGAIATTRWNNLLEVSASAFIGNESDYGGGAIQVNGGTVNISDSSFSNNSSSNNGGAIKAMSGRVRVRNSTFDNNHGYVGGVIYVNRAEVTLTHLTLTENRSKFGGDGLFVSSGLVRLRNSIVSGFTSQDDCVGRLDQHRGNLIADWSCSAFLGGNPLIGENQGPTGYRPLRDGSPALDAADPEFCPETDQIGTPRPQGGGCDIGAIESTKAAPPSIPVTSICNLSFQITAANQDRWIGACPAGNGADAIELTEDIILTEPLPRITSDITINGNGHTISGDNRFRIFDVYRGNFTIKDLTLANGNAPDYVGGAMALGHWAAVEATNVVFINNTAQLGGAIYLWPDAKLRVAHSRFHGNSASYRGGALDVRGSAEISHSVLSENTAASDGGAIFAGHDTLHINNSTFEGNVADEGGALYVDNGEVTLTHVTMLDNRGQNGGDAIHRRKRGWGEIILRNSIIAGGSDNADCAGYLDQNVANLIEDGSCLPTYQGAPLLGELPNSPGAYAPKDASPLINAGDTRFCLDTDQAGRPRPVGAACDIGAIESTSDFAATAAPAPRECSLHDRILAANTDSAVGGCAPGTSHDIIVISEDINLPEVLPAIRGEITIEGGGHTISGNNQFRIFEVRGGNLTINNLTLADGHAAFEGGAVYLYNGASVTVNDSTFINNSAQWGGAIKVAGGASTLSVSGSHFTANRAVNNGGAILLANGRADIINSSFSNNSSKAYGGGAFATLYRATMTVTNSAFFGNRAPTGGAVALSSRADADLMHVTMLDNEATENGEGHAIAISKNDSRVRLHNSIIAGVPESGEACHGQLLESSGNLIEDGSCAPALRRDPEVTYVIGQQRYLPPSHGSPAIDAADPQYCPPTDQLGNPRPQGDGCDIGAIEYMGE